MRIHIVYRIGTCDLNEIGIQLVVTNFGTHTKNKRKSNSKRNECTDKNKDTMRVCVWCCFFWALWCACSVYPRAYVYACAIGLYAYLCIHWMLLFALQLSWSIMINVRHMTSPKSQLRNRVPYHFVSVNACEDLDPKTKPISPIAAIKQTWPMTFTWKSISIELFVCSYNVDSLSFVPSNFFSNVGFLFSFHCRTTHSRTLVLMSKF